MQDASAEEMVTAFLLGAEGAIRVRMTLGRAHYNHGFRRQPLQELARPGCWKAPGPMVCKCVTLGLCDAPWPYLAVRQHGKTYNAGICGEWR